ncbi:unnamed protein product [Miscanthus lutarioriparius]|uniref:Uncharacterized protein n=1 Tax=Miscanthus lutarioriparius TaxID=422564 RepID=A0A811SDQ4_9POAL|nr:unnamed protein product [Miscanthus lutarioriparius]
MPPPVTAPTHPPPPSESTTTTRPQQQQPPPPPPPPPSGVESEVPPKKRKLEEEGFQRSPYYTIRETVANLRGRFLQVCHGTDSEKKDAAVEILNEMKDVIELSKKTRLDLSAAAEPVIPFDKHAARAPEHKRAEKVLSEEKSLGPTTSLAGNFVHSTGGGVPLKPDNSDTAAHGLPVKTKNWAGPRDSGNLRLIRRDPGDNAGLRVRDQCKFYIVHFIRFNFDQGYHREVEDEYGDEYYDQDEYLEEGSGAGDEYVEEEEPTEGQKEILELRERLKEQIRRKAKAAAACTTGRSSSSQMPQARDKFGSFFGPSKPVISRRVIEERKSLKELHSTIAREPRPSGVHKDIPSSSKVQSKGNGHQHKQKIVNQVKRKVEALKDNRDYSFLLSDDADLSPSPKEKPAARSSLTQRADREVMQSTVKSKAPTSQPARLSNGYGPKNTMSTQRHAEGRVDSMRKEAFLNRERVVSRDSERTHCIARNGSNQASTSKTTIQKLPSRGPIVNKQPSKDLNDATLWKSSVASEEPSLRD